MLEEQQCAGKADIECGYCRVRGRDLILLDRRLRPEEQVNIILQALSRFDLEAVYLPSWIREQLSVEP